jgi:hypothetical protein
MRREGNEKGGRWRTADAARNDDTRATKGLEDVAGIRVGPSHAPSSSWSSSRSSEAC